MPRDYRNFETFDIKEIYVNHLEDKEWLGKRLSFLWDIRDHYSQLYTTNRLSREKDMFYDINDHEIMKIARKDYHSKHLALDTSLDVKKAYKKLRQLKEKDPKAFLSRENIALYDHILNNYSAGAYLS